MLRQVSTYKQPATAGCFYYSNTNTYGDAGAGAIGELDAPDFRGDTSGSQQNGWQLATPKEV